MDALTDEYFNVYLCHVCKTKESFHHSKFCSGCKLISYCGTEHQNVHWKAHKSVCKAVQKICYTYWVCKDDLFILPAVRENLTPKDQWDWKRADLEHYIKDELKRELKTSEINMIYDPKHCAVCFTTKITKDFVCTKCFSFAYCSEEHQTLGRDAHEQVCSKFQNVLDMKLFCFREAVCDPKVAKTDKSIDLNKLDMQRFISKYISHGLKFEAEALVGFCYTGVLTFAHVISQIPNFQLGKTLTIHIVGAKFDVEGGRALSCWEYLHHLFPELYAVTIVLIGPEVGVPEHKILELGCCNECYEANKSIMCLFRDMPYHECFNSIHIPKPDVIVAYNSGLFDCAVNDSWGPSIPFFFKHESVPFICTAYNKYEAEQDLERLVRESAICERKIKVILECEENPFKDLMPFTHWKIQDAVCYRNNYVSAIIVENE